MSRYSTPDSDIGRLTITGISKAAKSDMPATTRSSTQRQRNLAASQRASSGTAAGSSRVVAGPSRATASSALQRSSRQAERERQAARRRRRGGGKDPDRDSSSDDDDDEEDRSDDEDGQRFQERRRNVIILTLSVYTDMYLTPREFVTLDQNDETATESTYVHSNVEFEADAPFQRLHILKAAQATPSTTCQPSCHPRPRPTRSYAFSSSGGHTILLRANRSQYVQTFSNNLHCSRG